MRAAVARSGPSLTRSAFGLCLAVSAMPVFSRARAEDPRAASAAEQTTVAADQPAATGTANELAPTYPELLALRRGLASEHADARATALTTLTELGSEALPVIRERLGKIAAELAPGALAEPLQALRAAVDGGPRPDLATGILRLLEHDQSAPTVLLCELVALLRALEAQQSLAATQVIVSDLLTLEPRLFRPEAVHERKRLGKLLVPAYLRHRRDARPAVQKLARESLSALAANSDERLFREPDGELQAAIITALGDAYSGGSHERPAAPARAAAARLDDVRERSSVPWVVAHLDDARPVVREAARRTTQRYGAAADEAVRQRSTDLLGTPPEPTWATARVLEQLLVHIDAERRELASAALQAARSALDKGELGDAEQQLALALAEDPSEAQRVRIATAYQELGKRLDEADLPTRALVAARRAVRLSPDNKQARARALYLEAERRLGSGVADLQALRTAGTLDPSHPDALPLLEELRGGRIASALQLRRQLGFLAAGLFAVAAGLVLYLRRATLRRARSQARKEGSAARTLPSI